MSSRLIAGIVAGALVLGGAAVFWTTRADDGAASEAVPAAAAVPSQLAPVEAAPEVPDTRRHIRKENIRLLHPPEKKDFSNVSVPAPSEGEDDSSAE